MASNYRAWLRFRSQTLNQVTFKRLTNLPEAILKTEWDNQNWAPETLSSQTLGRTVSLPVVRDPAHARPSVARASNTHLRPWLRSPRRSAPRVRTGGRYSHSARQSVGLPRDLCWRDPQSPWPPPGPPPPPSRPPLGLRLTPSHPLNPRAPVTRRRPSRWQKPGGGAQRQRRASLPERRPGGRGTSRDWRTLLYLWCN